MRLSVVMSVFNGAPALPQTLDSILGQTESDFELIVVDDGSRDATASILADCAQRDERVRVIRQENTGLTRALIRGCAEARADVIARHDCGDRSLPNRFASELALFGAGHVLVGCRTLVTGPNGEPMYVRGEDGDEIRRSLLHDDAAHVHGMPSHGSAMFRRDAYLASGGYRPQFRVAQDLDLWIRLARLGTIGMVDEPLYEMTFDVAGITGRSRPAQLELTGLAVALRDTPSSETQPLLARAENVRVERGSARASAASANYFVASMLLARKDPRWRDYARTAVRHDPLHLRAWAKLLLHR